MNMYSLTPEERKKLHALFHYLWTRDVGTVNYDKSKWRELDLLINKAMGPGWLADVYQKQ